MPVAVAGALAAVEGLFDWTLFLVSLVAGVLLHIGTNITNEIYDVRKGVDTIVSPRASHAIVKGRIADREAYVLAIVAFAAAFALGVYLVSVRGWPIVALGLAGLIGGYTYTAPPFQYKYKALGLPLVFLQMGVLMVVGSQYVVAGFFDPRSVILAIPIGLLVAALLVPVYGSATLVDDNGPGVLLVVAVPAVISAAAWIALWRKCARGNRVSGYVAWTCVWALAGFCVLAILSIGIFVAPVAVLLASAASLTPSGPVANGTV